MIFTSIIGFFLNIVAFIISFFPATTATDTAIINSIYSATSNLQNYLGSANYWFPLDDLYTAVKLFIGVNLIIFTFTTIRWLSRNLSGGIVK